MSKHLLENTKRYFVNWFNAQPPDVQYILMSTSFRENTEAGRFRRLYLKTMNDLAMKRLKQQALQRRSGYAQFVLEHDIPSVSPAAAPAEIQRYQCRHCPKQFISLNRRRIHERKYHPTATPAPQISRDGRSA